MFDIAMPGMSSIQIEDICNSLKQIPVIEKYRNTTVFITGATGFIGKTLVLTLAYSNLVHQTGIHIVAAVRNKEKAEKVFGKLLEEDFLELYISDMIYPLDYEKSVDYIFHTASVTTSKTMVEQPAQTIHTAYAGTKNILDFAVSKVVKSVVYLSSMEVYGKPDPALGSVKESDLGYIDLMNVRSSYSEGKRICECLCTAYFSEYNVPVKMARLAQTFGAGVAENDNRVYAQFARSAMRGENIVLHSDGKSEGNYCYISDAIAALLLLGAEGKNGEAYNVVNESTHMQIREMAHLVAEKIAGGNLQVIFDIPDSDKTYG